MQVDLPMVEKANKEASNKNWLKLNFEFGDIITLVLVIWQLCYCLYYFYILLPNDTFRVELILFNAFSLTAFLVCFGGLIFARNIWYVLFLLIISLNVISIQNVIKNDFKKLESLYYEISKNKSGFPIFLNQAQSENGPKYFNWAYQNINATSFSIYCLKGSDLKVRNYPNDLGWVDFQSRQIFYILMSNRSEIDKEHDIAKQKLNQIEPDLK